VQSTSVNTIDLSNKNLKTLVGLNIPQEVGVHFSCSNNQLTSLEGAPQEVGGNFYCSYNQLTSLEGAPQKVGGNFYCHHNQLTSFEGAPQEVGGMVYIRYNNKVITSIDQLREELMFEREFRGTGFEDVFDL
jgi:hypothetical protein